MNDQLEAFPGLISSGVVFLTALTTKSLFTESPYIVPLLFFQLKYIHYCPFTNLTSKSINTVHLQSPQPNSKVVSSLKQGDRYKK